MSRTITISVDLDGFDAETQIDDGIKTLEALKSHAATGPAIGRPELIPPETYAPKAVPPPPPANETKTEAPPPPPANETKTEVPPPPPATQTETVAPAGVDLDAEGLPWDGRIHASSRTKLVKGDTWKLKRGVDPELVEKVKAELRAAMAAPAAPTKEEDELDPIKVFGGDASEVPDLPEQPITFPEIMQIITSRSLDGTLQKVDLDNLLQTYQLPNIGMLGARPDLFASFAEDLDAL